MKNLTVLFLLAIFSLSAQAQNQEAYVIAMKQNMSKMAKANSTSEWEQVASGFDRISKVAKQTWIPSYYSVYSYIIASFVEKDSDSRDALLDKAQLHMDKLLEKYESESEILALQGFIWQGRMSVKGSRGMSYGPKTTELFMRAIELNPKNPRAHYLLGSNLIHTPKMFGGGVQNALPHLQKAQEVYESVETNEAFFPNWGADDNKRLLEKCSKANEGK